MEDGAEEQLFHEESCQVEMTVEEVIERHVGSLGLSQLVQVVLVSLAWMFDSQNTLVTIFTDAQPSEWRCKAEACSDGGGGVCGLLPGTWEWVAGHGSTTIAEWGLICNHKFLAAIPTSLFFLGSLLGTFFNFLPPPPTPHFFPSQLHLGLQNTPCHMFTYFPLKICIYSINKIIRYKLHNITIKEPIW